MEVRSIELGSFRDVCLQVEISSIKAEGDNSDSAVSRDYRVNVNRPPLSEKKAKLIRSCHVAPFLP